MFLPTIRKLTTAYQLFEQISDKNVRKLGLTPGQFDVLATLGNQLPMSCKELAKKTLMVKGNLTVILDGLLKKGLIIRQANPSDARSVVIALTEAGEACFRDVFDKHINYLKPLIDSFDDIELNGLNNELTKFIDRLKSHNLS